MSDSPDFTRTAVLGAGAWGTALANVAARAGMDVVLWARNPDIAMAMSAARENARSLPGIPLENRVAMTSDLACLNDAQLVLSVVPAQATRALFQACAGKIAPGVPVVICAKGIERGSGAFMSDIAADLLPDNPAAILSGPSFAHDVARGLPTAVTLASHDGSLAEALASALATHTFRPYHATDVRGVEIGGAAKNVLAIASGIVAGRQLGASASAALIARGFAELRRFGAAFGAHAETFMGLSGLGDLVLTCGTEQSRNFAFGLALGKGATVEEAAGGKLAEGAYTASALMKMARGKKVDMPVSEAVDMVLTGQLDIPAAIERLLSRPLRGER